MGADTPLSDQELDQALAVIRDGETVQTPGSRCHSTYAWQDGAWFRDDFDEGHTERRPSSEGELRELASRQPRLFRSLLQQPLWRRYRQAMEDDDVNTARAALEAWLAHGDRLDRGRVLLAMLHWPETNPDEGTRRLIAGMLRGLTAFHLFMETCAWQKDADTPARGRAFVDQLYQMAGDEAPTDPELRDRLHRMFDPGP